jgi:hypothetical protein
MPDNKASSHQKMNLWYVLRAVSPAIPPNVNSLPGLPLTFLPAPARTEVITPPARQYLCLATAALALLILSSTREMGPRVLHSRLPVVLALSRSTEATPRSSRSTARTSRTCCPTCSSTTCRTCVCAPHNAVPACFTVLRVCVHVSRVLYVP